jgi:hypothetical protein
MVVDVHGNQRPALRSSVQLQNDPWRGDRIKTQDTDAVVNADADEND